MDELNSYESDVDTILCRWSSRELMESRGNLITQTIPSLIGSEYAIQVGQILSRCSMLDTFCDRLVSSAYEDALKIDFTSTFILGNQLNNWCAVNDSVDPKSELFGSLSDDSSNLDISNNSTSCSHFSSFASDVFSNLSSESVQQSFVSCNSVNSLHDLQMSTNTFPSISDKFIKAEFKTSIARHLPCHVEFKHPFNISDTTSNTEQNNDQIYYKKKHCHSHSFECIPTEKLSLSSHYECDYLLKHPSHFASDQNVHCDSRLMKKKKRPIINDIFENNLIKERKKLSSCSERGIRAGGKEGNASSLVPQTVPRVALVCSERLCQGDRHGTASVVSRSVPSLPSVFFNTHHQNDIVRINPRDKSENYPFRSRSLQLLLTVRFDRNIEDLCSKSVVKSEFTFTNKVSDREDLEFCDERKMNDMQSTPQCMVSQMSESSYTSNLYHASPALVSCELSGSEEETIINPLGTLLAPTFPSRCNYLVTQENEDTLVSPIGKKLPKFNSVIDYARFNMLSREKSCESQPFVISGTASEDQVSTDIFVKEEAYAHKRPCRAKFGGLYFYIGTSVWWYPLFLSYAEDVTNIHHLRGIQWLLATRGKRWHLVLDDYDDGRPAIFQREAEMADNVRDKGMQQKRSITSKLCGFTVIPGENVRVRTLLPVFASTVRSNSFKDVTTTVSLRLKDDETPQRVAQRYSVSGDMQGYRNGSLTLVPGDDTYAPGGPLPCSSIRLCGITLGTVNSVLKEESAADDTPLLKDEINPGSKRNLQLHPLTISPSIASYDTDAHNYFTESEKSIANILPYVANHIPVRNPSNSSVVDSIQTKPVIYNQMHNMPHIEKVKPDYNAIVAPPLNSLPYINNKIENYSCTNNSFPLDKPSFIQCDQYSKDNNSSRPTSAFCSTNYLLNVDSANSAATPVSHVMQSFNSTPVPYRSRSSSTDLNPSKPYQTFITACIAQNLRNNELPISIDHSQNINSASSDALRRRVPLHCHPASAEIDSNKNKPECSKELLLHPTAFPKEEAKYDSCPLSCRQDVSWGSTDSQSNSYTIGYNNDKTRSIISDAQRSFLWKTLNEGSATSNKSTVTANRRNSKFPLDILSQGRVYELQKKTAPIVNTQTEPSNFCFPRRRLGSFDQVPKKHAEGYPTSRSKSAGRMDVSQKLCFNIIDSKEDSIEEALESSNESLSLLSSADLTGKTYSIRGNEDPSMLSNASKLNKPSVTISYAAVIQKETHLSPIDFKEVVSTLQEKDITTPEVSCGKYSMQFLINETPERTLEGDTALLKTVIPTVCSSTFAQSVSLRSSSSEDSQTDLCLNSEVDKRSKHKLISTDVAAVSKVAINMFSDKLLGSLFEWNDLMTLIRLNSSEIIGASSNIETQVIVEDCMPQSTVSVVVEEVKDDADNDLSAIFCSTGSIATLVDSNSPIPSPGHSAYSVTPTLTTTPNGTCNVPCEGGANLEGPEVLDDLPEGCEIYYSSPTIQSTTSSVCSAESSCQVDPEEGMLASASASSTGSGYSWEAMQGPVVRRDLLPLDEEDAVCWREAISPFDSDTDKGGYESDDDFDNMDAEMRRLEEKLKKFELELGISSSELSYECKRPEDHSSTLRHQDIEELKSFALPVVYPTPDLLKTKHLSLMKEDDEDFGVDSEEDCQASNKESSTDSNALFSVKSKVKLKPGDRRYHSELLPKIGKQNSQDKCTNAATNKKDESLDESLDPNSPKSEIIPNSPDCGSACSANSCRDSSEDTNLTILSNNCLGYMWLEEDGMTALDFDELEELELNDIENHLFFIFEDDEEDYGLSDAGEYSTGEIPADSLSSSPKASDPEAMHSSSEKKPEKGFVSSFKSSFKKAAKYLGPKVSTRDENVYENVCNVSNIDVGQNHRKLSGVYNVPTGIGREVMATENDFSERLCSSGEYYAAPAVCVITSDEDQYSSDSHSKVDIFPTEDIKDKSSTDRSQDSCWYDIVKTIDSSTPPLIVQNIKSSVTFDEPPPVPPRTSKSSKLKNAPTKCHNTQSCKVFHQPEQASLSAPSTELHPFMPEDHATTPSGLISYQSPGNHKSSDPNTSPARRSWPLRK